MGKQNPDYEWNKKWEKRPLIKPSTGSQSNGTKPIIIDSRYTVIRESLPEGRRGMFDDFISSLLNPKPK